MKKNLFEILHKMECVYETNAIYLFLAVKTDTAVRVQPRATLHRAGLKCPLWKELCRFKQMYELKKFISTCTGSFKCGSSYEMYGRDFRANKLERGEKTNVRFIDILLR